MLQPTEAYRGNSSGPPMLAMPASDICASTKRTPLFDAPRTLLQHPRLKDGPERPSRNIPCSAYHLGPLSANNLFALWVALARRTRPLLRLETTGYSTKGLPICRRKHAKSSNNFRPGEETERDREVICSLFFQTCTGKVPRCPPGYMMISVEDSPYHHPSNLHTDLQRSRKSHRKIKHNKLA